MNPFLSISDDLFFSIPDSSLFDLLFYSSTLDLFSTLHLSPASASQLTILNIIIIKEVHNVWSSLFIGLIPTVFLFWAIGNPTREWRHFALYGVLSFIGFGSMCLHSTLTKFSQSLDEVPMLYFNSVCFFSLCELNSPVGQPRFGKLFPVLMLAICICQTLIYYKFQELYYVFVLSCKWMGGERNWKGEEVKIRHNVCMGW